jgi:acetylornithine deacetylase/succinyl-diaminopimelate desuccinylase family protein
MSPAQFGKKDLLAVIDADTAKHISFLQALIRTPSPTPPGDTADAIDVVRKYLELEGISTKLIAPKPDSPNLVSVLHGMADPRGTGSSPRLVLNGHIDQFPVSDASEWQRDPFSGDVENGYVYGRSGVDMKAGTAASIIAFSYLHKLRTYISGRCTLEVVSDEEAGGRWGTRYLLEDDGVEEWKGDCVLVGEPSGLQSVRFGEKGTLRLDFKVTAPGAHGAYTHRSEGAIRIASRFIEKLVALEKLDLGMDESIRNHMQQPDVRKLADEIMWPGASNSMLFPTVNIGTIQGGTSINMVPSECIFTADIRIPIGVETKAVREYIDDLLQQFKGVSYSTRENHSHEAAYSDPKHEMVSLLQDNVRALRGEIPLALCSLGATDCKHFLSHGIPAYAYGPHPRGMAERDEKVSIEEFLDTIRVHTLAAWDYLGGPQ